MAETSVGPDLLQPLQVLAELAVDAVGEDLGVLSVDNVALSVEEPARDFVLEGILDDGHNAFEFFGGKVAGPLRQIDIGLFTHKIGVSPPNTLHFCQGIHDLLPAVHIGIQLERSSN